MKDGKIAEQGTHENLVSNDEDYNHLISLGKTQNSNNEDDINKEEDNDIQTIDGEPLKGIDYNNLTSHGRKSNFEEEEDKI